MFLMNRRKQHYEARKAANLCTECGKVPPTPFSFKCDGCLGKIKLRARGTPGQCHYSRKCSLAVVPERKYCQEHLGLLLNRAKNKRLRAKAGGPCAICGEQKDTAKSACERCRSRLQERRQLQDKQLRDSVYARYGGYNCHCCGETIPSLLTLDHVNNDGAEHRKQLGGNQTTKLYKWIIAHNFPPIFQVACWNCNVGKHLNGGVCPHQTIRTANAEGDPSSSPETSEARPG